MKSHTPGPWRLDITEVYGHVMYTVMKDDNILIAAMTDCPNVESNGRLMVAAPDLVAACHSALKLLRGSGFTENTKAIIELKAAIAKAEVEK